MPACQDVLGNVAQKDGIFMTVMMQVLLFAAYAVLGAAAMFLSPRILGITEQAAQLFGIVLFFGAWQVQNLLIVRKVEKEAQSRIAVLEDVTTILRGDLERTRRHSRKGDEKSDVLVSELKVLHTLLSQVMAQEGKLKPGGKKKKADEKAPLTDEQALELSIEKAPAADVVKETPESMAAKQSVGSEETPAEPEKSEDSDVEVAEIELTPDEAALVVEDGLDEEIVTNESAVTDEGEIAETVSASSDDNERTDTPIREDAETRPPARSGVAPRPGKKKAPIRLIKREDQLLSVVRSSLAENRVDLYLQPIVSLPSRRSAHYECFSRVRDEEGRIILPRQYMKVAENKGLIGTIDNLLLFRLIQLVRRLGKRRPDVRFFCNMSRHSMEDEEFFPQFIDFMTGNEEFRDRLVFEISQDDYYLLDGDVKDRLLTLGRKGFGFSMDMVKDFNKDFALLGDRKFQFIKTDLGDLMESHPEDGDVDAWKSFLRRNGMQLIASRIESEEMVLKALDSRVEFAQGYLFGEPTASNHLGNEF